MAQRPILPLEAQAAIERAREYVLARRLSYDMLFPVLPKYPPDSLFFPVEPKPATLKLQLSRYSTALFDAEVQFYPGHAHDETEMKSWLKEAALRIGNAVLHDMQPYTAFHDLHCTDPERKEAIIDALKQRIDYWVERGPLDIPDESADTGIEEPLPQTPLPIINAIPVEPKPSRKHDAQFPNRAIWLQQRLTERGWDHNDLPRHGGPDRKTALKILAGGEVRPDVLDKLAKALSFSARATKVTILDIPTT